MLWWAGMDSDLRAELVVVCQILQIVFTQSVEPLLTIV